MAKVRQPENGSLLDEYVRKTPSSRRMYERSCRSLIGGVSSNNMLMQPYPPFIERGDGPYIYDIDGNRYVDFVNAHSALTLGHNHPKVKAAILEQAEKGSFFGPPSELQTELAEIMCNRVPGLEKLRYACDGTKATMFALRTAKAYAGKEKYAKMEGGFHGTHDAVYFGLGPHYGFGEVPGKKVTRPGIPKVLASQVVLLPFNDIERSKKLIEQHKDELAAVMMEPVLGVGYLPPIDNYLQFLREICDRYKILLIFDEMVTLGMAPGGAQEYYGVVPDLTCFGKVMGGGMPIGGFGGLDKFMEICDPRSGMPKVNIGATFAGHPISMASGVAHMKAMTPAVYHRLSALGDRLRSKVNGLGAKYEIGLRATGVAHLFSIELTDRPVETYEDFCASDHAAIKSLMLSMTYQGYYVSMSSRCCVNAAMDEGHVDGFEDALEVALKENGLAG